MPLPRLIALCGNPHSGKSTAAELLAEIYGYEIWDDGGPARRIAMDYFGLTHEQVHTQAGKMETVEILGRTWTVREILGEIANGFEEKFGVDAHALMNFNRMDPETRYVLPSVRRDQGFFWRSQGALVIEIVNPQAARSPYEFDRYNPRAVQRAVVNDGLAEGLSEDDALIRLCDRLVAAIEGDAGAEAA